MGNIPFNRRFIRRLTGNSSGTVSVSIPIEYAAELGWSKGKEVKIQIQDEKIVIDEIRPETSGGSK